VDYPSVPVGHVVSATATGNLTGSPSSLVDGMTSEFSAALAVTDAIPPAVSDSEFLYDLPNPGALPHRLRYVFGENVSASLGTNDLMVENLTGGQPVPAASISLSYDAATNTATFAFPGFASGLLPDGKYRATLLSTGITDAAGNLLDGDGNGTPGGDHVMNFFFLAGDANHDGTVNLLDFNIMAGNFGSTSARFSEGDFNYDGVVNLLDFNILTSNFSETLFD
jgi:hypothetical protein